MSLIKRDNTYQFVFGPVPSRRLGISLGIDLLPHKTCTLNCVYCECGKTTHLTVKRKEYVPTEAVIQELTDYLEHKPELDYITFAGSGEPTLHSGIGHIIRHIKANYPFYKVALLTNGTLFDDAALRNDVSGADLIIASVDAGTEEVFHKINRPHPHIDFEAYKNGLIALSNETESTLWLELFIVPDINTHPSELHRIKTLMTAVRAEKIQLNVLDRPGTEDWVKQADEMLQREIADFLGIEIIHKKASHCKTGLSDDALNDRLLSMIKRRPCTLDDLVESLGVDREKAWQHICNLLARDLIKKNDMPRGTFYFV